MKKILIIVVALTALLLVACGPSVKVKRISPDTTVDLSGRWNSTDSRLVAEEMIRDVLSRPWLTNFASKSGRKIGRAHV